VLRDLLAHDFRMKLEPKRRAEWIQGLMQQYRGGSRHEVIALGRWLSDKGEYARVTQLITPEAALIDADLFLVYGDALASQAAWTQLESMLSRTPLPIEPVVAEVYRARVARELKKDQQADAHWTQAQGLAADNIRALRYVAEYAERLGQTAEAVKAYRRLTENPDAARPAFVALLRLTERTSNTAALRSLMREVIARFPDDPAPRIDLAYLDLLAGENIAQARAIAKQLCDQHPEMVAYRATLALAHLRGNETAAAQALFKDPSVDGAALRPGWQAVKAAVLGAGGQRDAARQLARLIATERLKPEERALVQPWLESSTPQKHSL
jgi:tetratricopeptide (TPR) repeat protein